MRVLSYDEAAGRANTTRRTLQRLIAKGEGPSVVHVSVRRRGILESDMDGWLLNRRHAAPGLPAAAPPPPRPESPYGTLAPVTPQVDVSGATNAAVAADQAKMSFEQLGSVSVAPNVDTAAIDLAIGKVRELNAELAKTGSLASSVGSGISADTAAAARLHSALGSIQRGRFATGGVQGD